MYHCEIDNKKIKVRDIFNNYEIYEKRLRRSELETRMECIKIIG